MNIYTSLPELGQYTFLSYINSGYLSGCWKALNKKTQETFCIRSIPKAAIESPELSAKFANHINMFKLIDNKYVASLIEIIEDDKAIHIVTELPDGQSLHDYIIKNGPMHEKYIIEMIARLFYIIQYLNDKFLINFMPMTYDNIFIDDSGHLTRYIYPFDDFLHENNKLIMSMFSPPEIISSRKSHPNSMAWCLASLTYYCLLAKLPFEGNTEEELGKSILTQHADIPTTISEEAQQFLNRAFVKNPLMRCSVIDLFVTDFLKGVNMEPSSYSERRSSAQIAQTKSFMSLRKMPSFTMSPSMDFNDASSFSKKPAVKLSYKSNIVGMRRMSKGQLKTPLG